MKAAAFGAPLFLWHFAGVNSCGFGRQDVFRLVVRCKLQGPPRVHLHRSVASVDRDHDIIAPRQNQRIPAVQGGGDDLVRVLRSRESRPDESNSSHVTQVILRASPCRLMSRSPGQVRDCRARLPCRRPLPGQDSCPSAVKISHPILEVLCLELAAHCKSGWTGGALTGLRDTVSWSYNPQARRV